MAEGGSINTQGDQYLSVSFLQIYIQPSHQDFAQVAKLCTTEQSIKENCKQLLPQQVELSPTPELEFL